MTAINPITNLLSRKSAALVFARSLLCCALFFGCLNGSAWAQNSTPESPAPRVIVSLQRQGNHVLCPITVEGQKLRLVLDTGAHGIVLQNAALKRLHLSVRGAANLHGINGVERATVYQAETVEVGAFAGKLAFRGVPVYAMRDLDANFDGIFGLDFFRGVPVTWDLQADQLQLAPPPAPSENPSRVVVPFQTFPSFGIFVPVSVDGEKGWMLLDSGSDSTLLTEKAARTVANAKGIEPAKTWTQATEGVGGAQGQAALSQYTGNFALQLDALPGVPLGISPLTAASSAEAIFTDLEKINHTGLRFLGLLGMPFVDQFRAITFDYERKTLTLDGFTVRCRKTGDVSEVESIAVDRAARFFVPNGGQVFTNGTTTPVSPGEIVTLAPRARLEFFAPPAEQAATTSPQKIPAPLSVR